MNSRCLFKLKYFWCPTDKNSWCVGGPKNSFDITLGSMSCRTDAGDNNTLGNLALIMWGAVLDHICKDMLPSFTVEHTESIINSTAMYLLMKQLYLSFICKPDTLLRWSILTSYDDYEFSRKLKNIFVYCQFKINEGKSCLRQNNFLISRGPWSQIYTRWCMYRTSYYRAQDNLSEISIFLS